MKQTFQVTPKLRKKLPNNFNDIIAVTRVTPVTRVFNRPIERRVFVSCVSNVGDSSHTNITCFPYGSTKNRRNRRNRRNPYEIIEVTRVTVGVTGRNREVCP